MNPDDDPADAARDDIDARDEIAARDEATVVADTINVARRRHGAAGAIIAAGMLGFDQVLGRKPREEAPIVISTGDEPIDIDDEGILVAIDEQTSVIAPPQPRPDRFPARRRRRKKD